MMFFVCLFHSFSNGSFVKTVKGVIDFVNLSVGDQRVQIIDLAGANYTVLQNVLNDLIRDKNTRPFTNWNDHRILLVTPSTVNVTGVALFKQHSLLEERRFWPHISFEDPPTCWTPFCWKDYSLILYRLSDRNDNKRHKFTEKTEL
jgi:hypothetical protein